MLKIVSFYTSLTSMSDFTNIICSSVSTSCLTSLYDFVKLAWKDRSDRVSNDCNINMNRNAEVVRVWYRNHSVLLLIVISFLFFRSGSTIEGRQRVRICSGRVWLLSLTALTALFVFTVQHPLQSPDRQRTHVADCPVVSES